MRLYKKSNPRDGMGWDPMGYRNCPILLLNPESKWIEKLYNRQTVHTSPSQAEERLVNFNIYSVGITHDIIFAGVGCMVTCREEQKQRNTPVISILTTPV